MRTSVLRAFAISCAWVCLQNSASAQRPATDPIAAEKLFAEARKFLEAGKYAEACQKLSDSQKLDPAVGTLLNLAQCYEKLGKTATAWATYHEAAAAARSAGQMEREKKANRAADALEPEVPKLTVTVPDAAAAKGVEVKRNGNGLPSSLWGVAVPVDPGEYVIEARATGAKPWTTRVKAEPGRSVAVILPPFDEPTKVPPSPITAAASTSGNSASRAADSAAASDSSSSGMGGQRVAALVIGGAGLVGAGVGAVFAFSANASYDASGANCTPDNFCKPQGMADRDDAHKKATISTIALTAGGVAFAAGAVLWLTAPSNARSENARAPRLNVSAAALPGLGAGSISVNGSW